MDSQSPYAPTLRTAVQYVKGVGPERAQILERLGLHTVRDLLFFFPRDYVDLSERRTIEHLEEGVPVSVVVEVEDFEQRISSHGRSVLGVLLRQGNAHCRAVWFNQPFMVQRFRRGQTVVVSGTPHRRGLVWQFAHPRVTWVEGSEENTGEVLPVYPLTEGLKQHQIRRIVQRVVEQCVEQVPEVFPAAYLADERLCSIQTAIREVHIPTCAARLADARYRLVYQELLVMQLALAFRQQQLMTRRQAVPLVCDARIDARVRRLFPFQLTADQSQAIGEIATDMARPYPMNRMLQGDVGTGKTAVAAYAMLLAVAHQTQAVLMAPTEVLARQHYQTLSQLLQASHVRLRYLSGATPIHDRAVLMKELASGEANLLVGTQAVIQQDLEFHKLSLVIIDEQHKFGVLQRAILRQGNTDPHCLVMTATPIPRTIAMTLFGDLEVSSLRVSPPGRQPVYTYLGDDPQRERWWDFFRKKLREGQQGYVISPRVDDQDNDTTSAEAALEHLANGELADFRLDLLHGRLRTEEKLRIMDDFAAGKTQVLVATSVVEVGIDVPNANLMTIEHGERFGLSQLHQLRGRVGRGTSPGYVCVFAEPTTEEGRKRLEAFAASNDGFDLAEFDFQLRGPGELFGTRQHGLPPLMVADLRRDMDILSRARADARRLVDQDPGLSDQQWSRIRRMVLTRYGHALELADVA
jgi:ATP-dependent DNA helicase RecG